MATEREHRKFQNREKSTHVQHQQQPRLRRGKALCAAYAGVAMCSMFSDFVCSIFH
jgi:hypothetical protein